MSRDLWGRYHGGRQPSSDDSFHSTTVIPPSALDKPSIMKRHHRRRTCSHISSRRSPTMATLRYTRFVECRWWNDSWTVKTVVAWRSSASMIPAPGLVCMFPWHANTQQKRSGHQQFRDGVAVVDNCRLRNICFGGCLILVYLRDGSAQTISRPATLR